MTVYNTVPAAAQAGTATGWLLYKTDNPVVASGAQYDDDLQTQYQWDDEVPNHASIEAGDLIALWDGTRLLGISMISQIVTGMANKRRNRCPFCKRTNVRHRKTLVPPYKCGSRGCKTEFEDPISENIEVKTYRAHYGMGWKDLYGLVDRKTLVALCVNPRSQQSFRLLKPGALERLLKDHSLESQFNLIDQAQKSIKGGHKLRVAKQRIGQGAFRDYLLSKYGANCAISGPAPKKAIHACHLESYAAVGGDHQKEGGLLMRADLHSLFDADLLNIDPKSEKIILDRYLEQFPEYWRFNGNPLTISLTPKQKRWLKLRWENHSPPTV